MSDKWPYHRSRHITSLTLNTAFDEDLYKAVILVLMSLLSGIWILHSLLIWVTARPQHLSLSVSLWETGRLVLYPLLGKSVVVITSTSLQSHRPLNQVHWPPFLSSCKYRTLSLCWGTMNLLYCWTVMWICLRTTSRTLWNHMTILTVNLYHVTEWMNGMLMCTCICLNYMVCPNTMVFQWYL